MLKKLDTSATAPKAKAAVAKTTATKAPTSKASASKTSAKAAPAKATSAKAPTSKTPVPKSLPSDARPVVKRRVVKSKTAEVAAAEVTAVPVTTAPVTVAPAPVVAEVAADETFATPVLVSESTVVVEQVAPPAETVIPATASTTFHSLGLAQPVLDVLDRLGFVKPTPIQAQAIPVVVDGNDLVGIAQTGTGKTLAFGLPILHRFVEERNCGRSLILAPTRELALQIEEALAPVARALRLRTAVLIGGAPLRPQWTQLRNNPDIIVATPGRLLDHVKSGMIDLRTVDTLVLDEADRMLDMGFAPQIRQIVRSTPNERQTLLFSATMPEEISALASEFLYEPERVEIERPGTSAVLVTQELYVVAQEGKNDLLSKILYNTEGQVLIFARTRSRAHRIAREINNWDIRAAEIHADRSLSQRRQALDGFKTGRYRVLVATDIAARGIDVVDLPLVVNYDLPDCAEDYVHRIGRTGRAGKTGHAISFAAPDQWRDVRDIEKVIGKSLDMAADNTGTLDSPIRESRGSNFRNSRRGNGGRPRSGSGGPNRSHGGGGNRPRSGERSGR